MGLLVGGEGSRPYGVGAVIGEGDRSCMCTCLIGNQNKIISINFDLHDRIYISSLLDRFSSLISKENPKTHAS